MWVISWAKCREFAKDHAESHDPLERWYDLAEQARWKSFREVRSTFGKTVDRVGDCYIFDIQGGNFRLVAKISKTWKKVWIRHILTHAGYDRGKWQDDC